jgi:ATP:ADP antiporter, AAA family
VNRHFFKALNAEQGESFPIFLFLFLGWFLGGMIALTEVTAISMFIKSWDREHFPTAFCIAGITGIVTAHFYTKLQNWLPLSALAFFSLILVFLGDLFIFYSYRIEKSDWILYYAIAFSTAKTIITWQIFEGFFQTIFDSTQIRRLRSRSEAGLITGMVVFLILVYFMTAEKKADPEYFFLLSALLTAGAGIAVIAFAFNFSQLNHISSNVQFINAHNNYQSILKKPYERSIAVFTLFSAISLGLIDFIFYSIVKDRYETTSQTIEYLSLFFAVLTTLGFILAAFISDRVLNKYGYKVIMLLLPVCLSVFALIYCFISFRFGYKIEDDSFYLLFMIMGICKLLYMILYRGFELNTLKAYFIPVEQALRFDFQSRIEGFFRQMGKTIAAGLAILCLSIISWEFSSFPWILFIISAGWILATVKLHEWYRITLKHSLEKENFIINEERKINSYIDHLVYTAKKTEPHNLPLHLNILNILDPIEYKKAIVQLLDSEDDDVQRTALYQAGELCLLSAIPILEEVQKSKFYPVSRNRELIRRTYNRLKGAEFRLEKLKYIEQLTFSKIISERRFGALLSAYSSDKIKPKLLNKLFRDKDYKVRYNAVTASACSEAYDLHYNLIEKLAEPAYSNAAISAIAATGSSMIPALESTFHLTGQAEIVQDRIIRIYGRMASKEAVEQLIRKLNYTNQNVVAAAIDALSRCGITITGEKSIQFRREVEEVCQLLIWNMSAYNDLSRQNASELLLRAMKSEIQANYDALFKLLALLYDPQSVALVKENINSGDPDKTEFASELLDVFVSEEIKPMLLPIISVDSYETIVWKMSEYFPVSRMTETEILYDLIQRDYKWVNRWTKACALQELANSGKYDNHDIFIANLVNPDVMLRETAAMLLYKINKTDFKIYLERFKQEFNHQTGKEIISKNILGEIAEKNNSPALKFEMIRFLNGLEEFKTIPGIILLEIAKVMDLCSFKKEELIGQYESFDYFDYYIVEEGTILLKIDGKPVQEYGKGCFIQALHYINTEEHILVELEAVNSAALYKIRQEEFHDLISRYEEIPKALLTTNYSKVDVLETSL